VVRRHRFRAPVGHHDGIARLILLNGAPGVGKSTVARRFVAQHPLTLLVEVDALRVAMGGWREHPGTRVLARRLALALVATHLEAGHDVVMAQYLGRPDFVGDLAAAAEQCGAGFVEVVLVAPADVVTGRLRDRRASGTPDHPADIVPTEALADLVANALHHLAERAATGPPPLAVPADGSADATCARLGEALAGAGITRF
jgi:predicted kinase